MSRDRADTNKRKQSRKESNLELTKQKLTGKNYSEDDIW